MINLLDIRYVRLGTRNGDVADAFARELLGLELARIEASASYYRSDNRDHTLVYFGASSTRPATPGTRMPAIPRLPTSVAP